MSCVIVTEHAEDRTRERAGLPKRMVEKNAERAFIDGLEHWELKGSLKRFVDSLYLQHKNANNIRIYCGNVYLFKGNVLVTVISLPSRYRKTAESIKKNRGVES